MVAEFASQTHESALLWMKLALVPSSAFLFPSLQLRQPSHIRKRPCLAHKSESGPSITSPKESDKPLIVQQSSSASLPVFRPGSPVAPFLAILQAACLLGALSAQFLLLRSVQASQQGKRACNGSVQAICLIRHHRPRWYKFWHCLVHFDTFVRLLDAWAHSS